MMKEDPDGLAKTRMSLVCQEAAQRAIWLVLNEFPVKIKQIDILKRNFNWNSISSTRPRSEWMGRFVPRLDSHKPSQTNQCIQNTEFSPVLFECLPQFDSGAVMLDTNQKIHQMITRFKPFVMEFVVITNQILFGVSTLEPKIQTGNNFGVEVQNRALTRIVELSIVNYELYQNLNAYYSTRANAIGAMIRHPHIEDCQYCLTEVDIETMFALCCNVNQLYASYTELHDIVVKNIDKLMQPRDDEQ